jgi:hypothetical protein
MVISFRVSRFVRPTSIIHISVLIRNTILCFFRKFFFLLSPLDLTPDDG